MSLDISMLSPDGSPKRQVSIGVDDHDRLMQLVPAGDRLLGRLKDYYTDAQFEHSELRGLIAEATDLAACCRSDHRLFSFLKELAELAESAISEQKGLVAIAD